MEDKEKKKEDGIKKLLMDEKSKMKALTSAITNI